MTDRHEQRSPDGHPPTGAASRGGGVDLMGLVDAADALGLACADLTGIGDLLGSLAESPTEVGPAALTLLQGAAYAEANRAGEAQAVAEAALEGARAATMGP